MALKGERSILETDITRTCESAADPGLILCGKTTGSGIALGNVAGKADVMSTSSGNKVAGVLMHKVVDIDVTRQHLNFHNNETLKGNRCVLLRKGRITTDEIVAGQTPAEGGTAYLGAAGQFTATLSSTGGLVATPKVGEFRGGKDENGFATIDVNLPA